MTLKWCEVFSALSRSHLLISRQGPSRLHAASRTDTMALALPAPMGCPACPYGQQTAFGFLAVASYDKRQRGVFTTLERC